MRVFRVGHFEFFFSKKKDFFCFIPMKISHKLCIRMDGTQILWLWWFTAKNQSPQTFQPAVYNTTYSIRFFFEFGHTVRLPCAAATLCLSSQISMAASPPLNVIKLVENHLFKPHIWLLDIQPVTKFSMAIKQAVPWQQLPDTFSDRKRRRRRRAQPNHLVLSAWWMPQF